MARLPNISKYCVVWVEGAFAFALCAAVFGLAVRPRRERRVCRDHAEPLLVGKDLLAQFVPTHVELALELIDPFRRGLMRCVAAAGNVVEQERLIGCRRVQLFEVLNGVVRHASDHDVARLVTPRKDLRGVAEQKWCPLIRLAARSKPIPVGHWPKGPAVLY